MSAKCLEIACSSKKIFVFSVTTDKNEFLKLVTDSKKELKWEKFDLENLRKDDDKVLP